MEAVTGFGTLNRLREAEERLRTLAGVLNVSLDEVVEGAERRVGQVKALEAELRALRRQLAAGQADELAGTATDGVVVARVNGLARDDYRQLALEVRNKPGIDLVVLAGEVDGGGVAMVAAARAAAGHHAGSLIEGVRSLIGGGGGKGEELAVAGGKNVAGIDPALASIRETLQAGRVAPVAGG